MAFHLSQIAFVLVLIIGHISCQSLPSVKDLEGELQNIPGLENFNASSVTEEDLDRLLKEKCVKSGGGEEAYLALKNQKQELQACLESQVNTTALQAEIEVAKKTGSMDEVFGKYCKKSPEIFKCMANVTKNIQPCLEEAERETLNRSLELIEELKEFICFRDGDRLAMFISEGGVECLTSRQEGLEVCVNQTIGNRIPTEISANALPLFLITDKECNDFDRLRKCFNTELEKCSQSTPANIIDAFFKFLKKQLPCGNSSPKSAAKEEVKAEPNSSITLLASSLHVVLAVILAKYL